jgi:hypothetical protein
MHFRNVNILFQFLLVLIIDSIFVVVENGKNIFIFDGTWDIWAFKYSLKSSLEKM